ncbi:hypothetical protein U2I54_02865 [Bacillus pseudomycoides]|uniref:Uncharacterized protein n=1 Tax=Bacillus bingmayongensis TaxID=1150157 RepID=A0ABU5JRL3_9BACI|nr:hypothetical protein [Bacillus pseudomycoides]
MFALGFLMIYVMICIMPTAIFITGYVWQKERGRIFGAKYSFFISIFGTYYTFLFFTQEMIASNKDGEVGMGVVISCIGIIAALWTLTNSLYGGILLLIISFIGYVYNYSFLGGLSFFLAIGGLISLREHWRKKIS